MALNGISDFSVSTNQYSSSTSKVDNSSKNVSTSTSSTTDVSKNNDGVVYEKSSSQKTYGTYANPTLVNQLKSDAEARTQQLKSLVEETLSKQGKAFTSADNMWNLIRQGKVKVDSATAKQAQEDISENGYWGVKQTSERILSFAQALAGTDETQLEKMRDAFLKGYEKAEKTWGGKLPEISQKTYDAVLKGFDDLLSKNKTASVEE